MFGATSGCAAWQAGPPAGHLVAVVLKLLAEAAGESWVLDPVNEEEGNGQERGRVDEQHRLILSSRTVETNVAHIFTKLGLPPSTDDPSRVLAVLAYLRS